MYVRLTLVGVHTSCWQTLRLASHRQILGRCGAQQQVFGAWSMALRSLERSFVGSMVAILGRSWGEQRSFCELSDAWLPEIEPDPPPVAGTPT